MKKTLYIILIDSLKTKVKLLLFRDTENKKKYTIEFKIRAILMVFVTSLLFVFSHERYLAINQDELVGEDYKKVNAIVAKNESMFNKAGGYDYISYSSLDSLSRQDLLVLRSGEIKQVVRLASILFLCLFGVQRQF